jgi:hypothetical protein
VELKDFKPIEIQDKAVFMEYFRQDPPEISELTFTNLFIWRHQYRPVWMEWGDCLLIIYQPKGGIPYGLFPVGTGDKRQALETLCRELKRLASEVRICRVGEHSVKHHVDPDRYTVLPDRDNSDYVYLTSDLINLSGRKYHKKKNHVNQFIKNHDFEYRPLNPELVEHFFEMQEAWCRMRECVENPELLAEDYAIHEALTWFKDLDFQGGAILINAGVEAFSLGEMLNKETAVIHIEKANPEIPGLYAAINQCFCMNAWPEATYINREQDMGIDGLRKAKESYYPHHMVNKYTVIPK